MTQRSEPSLSRLHSLAERVGLDHVMEVSELLEDEAALMEPDRPAFAKPPGKAPETPLDCHEVTGDEDEDIFDMEEMVESKSRLYF